MLVYFLFFSDEDPALRELAEMEREGCLQDIQDLRQKVELKFFICQAEQKGEFT